jgi:hypothetical protein
MKYFEGTLASLLTEEYGGVEIFGEEYDIVCSHLKEKPEEIIFTTSGDEFEIFQELSNYVLGLDVNAVEGVINIDGIQVSIPFNFCFSFGEGIQAAFIRKLDKLEFEKFCKELNMFNLQTVAGDLEFFELDKESNYNLIKVENRIIEYIGLPADEIYAIWDEELNMSFRGRTGGKSFEEYIKDLGYIENIEVYFEDPRDDYCDSTTISLGELPDNFPEAIKCAQSSEQIYIFYIPKSALHMLYLQESDFNLKS